MKTFPLTFTIALTISLIFAFSMPAQAENKPKFAKGELLIKFKNGKQSEGVKALTKMGAWVINKLSKIDVSKIGLPKKLPVDMAIKKLAKLPFVDFVEPNYLFKPSWKTSDPKWDQQWGLTKIKTPRAWGMETGDSKVIIAILDTGVDLDHPDLIKKLVPGYDFIDNDNKPEDGQNGHGTHCAGIAAASTNNRTGMAGICAECSLMPVRVLSAQGGYASDVANGIIWAVDHGAKVISMSLGGPNESYSQRDAIDYAWTKGAVIIAAAGNTGISAPYYPAYQRDCIAVGAATREDTSATFSNWGSWVDVAAPGSQIMSTLPEGKYGYKSGTSMAAPFVAGLAGLLWSKMGDSGSNVKVRAAIENTCSNMGNRVSKGRINAAAAIANIKKATTPPAPKPSKPSAPSPAVVRDKSFSPSGYALKQGSQIKAPSNSLVKSDDSLLVLRSTQSSKKRHLDFYTWTKIKLDGVITELKITYEGRFYASAASITAYLWDWTGNKWDWIGKNTLQTKDTKLTFARTNPKAYVSPNGDVRVRFTAASNMWKTFEIGSDQVSFHVVAKEGR